MQSPHSLKRMNNHRVLSVHVLELSVFGKSGRSKKDKYMNVFPSWNKNKQLKYTQVPRDQRQPLFFYIFRTINVYAVKTKYFVTRKLYGNLRIFLSIRLGESKNK